MRTKVGTNPPSFALGFTVPVSRSSRVDAHSGGVQRFEFRARIAKVSGVLFPPDGLDQVGQLGGGGEFHALGFVPTHQRGQLAAGLQL